MKLFNLNDFKGGWVVGDFDPAIFKLKEAEVSIKRYSAGDVDEPHYHAQAVEITIIVSGIVKLNGVTYEANDILVLDKGDVSRFSAVTDVVTCVIKTPSVKDDKHIVL